MVVIPFMNYSTTTISVVVTKLYFSKRKRLLKTAFFVYPYPIIGTSKKYETLKATHNLEIKAKIDEIRQRIKESKELITYYKELAKTAIFEADKEYYLSMAKQEKHWLKKDYNLIKEWKKLIWE